MKNIFKVLVCVLLTVTIIAPVNAYGSLVTTEKVPLTSTNQNNRGSRTQLFTLNVYDVNGTTVYGFDVDDPDFREAAMIYIAGLTGDPTIGGSEPLPRMQSGYRNNTGQNGNASSYIWGQVTFNGSAPIATRYNVDGGASAGWFGTGNADRIILLHQSQFNGIGVTITWPPSLQGNGTSNAWSSGPVYSNIVGMSFSGLRANAFTLSSTFVAEGDVQVGGNRFFRPIATIHFPT